MGTTGFTEDVLNREIDYAISNIKVVTENESAWNYLRGYFLLLIYFFLLEFFFQCFTT